MSKTKSKIRKEYEKNAIVEKQEYGILSNHTLITYETKTRKHHQYNNMKSLLKLQLFSQLLNVI